MAKTVYDEVDITLQDGKDITLVPLAIGRLKRFMKAWAEFANVKNEDDAFDVYINCCGIALEKAFVEQFPDSRDNENFISQDYREYLEDVLDMDTIYKILDVCGGLKLNDPKLLEAAEELAREQALAGKS